MQLVNLSLMEQFRPVVVRVKDQPQWEGFLVNMAYQPENEATETLGHFVCAVETETGMIEQVKLSEIQFLDRITAFERAHTQKPNPYAPNGK